ncbi:MAG: DUF167 domain-containing protein [Alphaproteobacteria bacterium]|nr:DUF167 domain-containing protein [Alphaproteobacteria bacterium]MDE1986104.1 DUF167 domain-containing protein [Alphaproteobacteria bacterium]MDE2264434.1 DUF167 domain-containing protein [Alphaproteobacteria bacterium]MDE2499215.1 DUF167 domain-containing protein [Alphaproteobacteria bacterium]
MAARVRLGGGGVSLALRLTPKGGRDVVEGWINGADGMAYLKARVRAVPEDGKANKALIKLLADVLSVPKSAIRISAGGTARLKRVEIAGPAGTLASRLEALGDAP